VTATLLDAPPALETLPVGIYLRISQDRTHEERGVDRQGEDADALLARRGDWRLYDRYVDNDTSATKANVTRHEFERLLRDVEAGHVKVIIAWALDRLCRTPEDRLRILQLGKRTGLIICLVRGSDMDLSTPAGRLVADILGSVAANEIEVKQDRVDRASRQRAERGEPSKGGPVPFGFNRDRSHHPEQARAVRQAYSDVLNGVTLASIARAWGDDPVLASTKIRLGRDNKGQPSAWSAETVRALLLNVRNMGVRSLKGEIIGPAKWAPIVSEETYLAVRDVLTDPARKAAPPTPRHLLSGVARCGVCGERVVAGTTRPTYFSYRCRSRGHVARRGDHVDALIAGGVIEGVQTPGVVVKLLSRPDAIHMFLPPPSKGPDLVELRERCKTLRARLRSVALEFADDDTVSPAQLRTITERIRSRLDEAKVELAAAGRTSVLAPLVTADDVAAAWAALSVDRQRAVIDELMEITLLPTGQGARRFDPETVKIKPKAKA
jgi:site-specific DNA recombinase